MEQSDRWRDLRPEFEAELSDAADLSVRGNELIGGSHEDSSESDQPESTIPPEIPPNVESRFDELVTRAGVMAGGTEETGRETWLNLLREELPRDKQHFPSRLGTHYAASSVPMQYREISISQIDFRGDLDDLDDLDTEEQKDFDSAVGELVESFKRDGWSQLPREVQREAVIEAEGQSPDRQRNWHQPFPLLLVEPGDGDRYGAIPGQRLTHAACLELKLDTLWCAVREPGTEGEDESWTMRQDREVIEHVYTASAKLCGRLQTKALAQELATDQRVPEIRQESAQVRPSAERTMPADAVEPVPPLGSEGAPEKGSPAEAAEVVRFPHRAAWLKIVMRKGGHLTAHRLEALGRPDGPDHKTIQRILNGQPVRDDTLEKLADVLSTVGDEVSSRDIPVD